MHYEFRIKHSHGRGDEEDARNAAESFLAHRTLGGYSVVVRKGRLIIESSEYVDATEIADNVAAMTPRLSYEPK